MKTKSPASESWLQNVEHLSSVFCCLQEVWQWICPSASLGSLLWLIWEKWRRAYRSAMFRLQWRASPPKLGHYLVMVDYYQGYYERCSALASPFDWPTESKGEIRVVSAFQPAPVLAAPGYDPPFKLADDPSETGEGAVFLQRDSNGVEHPTSYFLMKLNCHQKWYPTIESLDLVF